MKVMDILIIKEKMIFKYYFNYGTLKLDKNNHGNDGILIIKKNNSLKMG